VLYFLTNIKFKTIWQCLKACLHETFHLENYKSFYVDRKFEPCKHIKGPVFFITLFCNKSIGIGGNAKSADQPKGEGWACYGLFSIYS
jgi:hypothetical protein